MTALSLAMLPQELLAHILGFNISYAAIDLWKSGDRLLMSKLKSGGVVEVKLSNLRGGSRHQTWPRCLKEFRLRSLFVRSGTQLLPCTVLRSELMRLYPGLTELRLCIPGALEAFSNDLDLLLASSLPLDLPNRRDESYSFVTEPRGPPERKTTKEGIVDDSLFEVDSLPKRSKHRSIESTQTLADLWDVERVFPSLKTLIIAENQSKKLNSLTFPSTVTSLDLTFHCGKSPQIDWSKAIPPNLETLELSANAWNETDFSEAKRVIKSFPKSLTLLKGRNPFLERIMYESPDGLWPNIAIDSSAFLTLAYVDHRPEMIPPRVDKLHLTVQVLPLPDSIKMLYYRNDVRLQDMPCLPTSLTTLRVTSDWRALRAFPPGPTHLTTLTCHGGFFGPSFFYLLPRTLTVLSNQSPEGQASDVVAETQLLSLGLACITGPEAENWRNAKLDLLKFANFYNRAFESMIETYITEVEKGALLGLPVNLIRLNCDYHWPSSRKFTLPPKLREFTSVANGVVSSSRFFDHLPLFLTSFTVRGSWSTTTARLAEPTLQLYNMPFLREMTLTHFDSELLASFFPFLPRSLASLDIVAINTPLKGSWLADLPPSLEVLKLECLAISPPDAWLRFLPRNLTDLNLKGSGIDGSDLFNLPPGLVNLIGPEIRNFGYIALRSLPRTIDRFEVSAPARKIRRDRENWVEEKGWPHLCNTFKPFRLALQESCRALYNILLTDRDITDMP